MFPEEIRLDKLDAKKIPGITTQVDYYNTEKAIRKLLDNMKCKQVLLFQDGDSRKIAFNIGKNPYIFRIPMVFLRGVYKEQIGIRLVYNFLKASLPYVEQGIIEGDQLLLSARLVWDKDGQMIPLSDKMEDILVESEFDGQLPMFSSGNKKTKR